MEDSSKILKYTVHIFALAITCLVGYLIYIAVTRIIYIISSSRAIQSSKPIKHTQIINEKTFPSLAEYQFYKMQGISMNDVLRSRLMDVSTPNKIVGDKNASYTTALRTSPTDVVLDNQMIYSKLSQAEAQKSVNLVLKGQWDGDNKTSEAKWQIGGRD